MMKKVNLFIVRFLLFFYLTSSYLSATHIHKNITQQHNDCKVCIVVKNLHSPDIPHINIDCLNCDNYYDKIIFNQIIVTAIILKGFNSNAPPKLS